MSCENIQCWVGFLAAVSTCVALRASVEVLEAFS